MKDFRTFGVSEKIENSEKIVRTAVRGHRPRPLDDGSQWRPPSLAGDCRPCNPNLICFSLDLTLKIF